MRVLVINENKLLLSLIHEVLEIAGHEVVSTSNGLEAYESIEKSAPDVVVMDLLLSFVSGYELIEFIREVKEKYINILVLSKVSMDVVIENAFELGIDDYMFLPLRKKELLARVERFSRYQVLEHQKICFA